MGHILGPAGGRRATAFVVAMHLPFVLAVATYTIPRHDLSAGGTALVVFTAMVIGGIQLRHSLAAARNERPNGWPLSFLLLALAVYVPLWWFTWDWAVAQWFVIASAAMLLPRALAWPVVVGPIVGTGVVAAITVSIAGARVASIFTVYFVIVLVMGSVALYASARFVGVIEELDGNRSALARTAVDRERLRISRDLHDLLGHSLAAVSLKGDLAVRLLETDEAAARSEIQSLTEVARGALHDIQAIARDQHAVSLHTEIDAAAALLDAAGIEAQVNVHLPALNRPVEEVIAWAVREGTTNILRHSDAHACSISGARRERTVRLQMTNDGARGPQAAGSGLAGLRERAEALSGSLVAGPTGDGRYELVVEIPEQAT